jgi:hypothetical protein
MKYKNRIAAAILLSFISSSFANEYSSGIHRWKVGRGTLTLVSGLVTNGMALYINNYNLYFQAEGNQELFQIPFVDKKKPGNYELALTAKAKGERMVRDARVEVRGRDVYLLRATSTREDDFNDSPIVVSRYRLIATESEGWPYVFQLLSSKTLPTVPNTDVDDALKQEAQLLK